MGSNSSIKDLLECPVCMTFMYSPIHQCCNGHTICFTCKTKVDNICPTCRQELGDIRCIALEKLAELLEIPCMFHEFGCQYTDSYRNRLSHEEICSFRPYSCPYGVDNCSVSGGIGSVFAHLKESHCVKVFDGPIFTRIYTIPETTEFLNCVCEKFSIFNCFGHQFYMHFEASNIGNTPVLMAFLRFMGDESEAANFRYCLEVGGKERKMTWQGIPRSIRDSVTSVRDSLDGLIIQKKNLELFFSVGGLDGLGLKLTVDGRIWRKDDPFSNIN